ncbi:MAG: hypothetical protein WBD06_08975, partial [Acidobacteriaceae bacterium]
MATTELVQRPSPAYLPFRTFLSALDALEHGLPRKLDRTVWRSQSGIVQGQIMMAFRFLGLINDADEPSPGLQRLVAPDNKEGRPKLIAALLQHAYRPVLDHDLTKMTPKMLDEEFAQYGVQGDTRRKAVAFFLRAAKFAELPMHPLLSAQTRNSVTGPRRKRKKNAEAEGSGGPEGAENPRTSVFGDPKTKAVTLASG